MGKNQNKKMLCFTWRNNQLPNFTGKWNSGENPQLQAKKEIRKSHKKSEKQTKIVFVSPHSLVSYPIIFQFNPKNSKRQTKIKF